MATERYEVQIRKPGRAYRAEHNARTLDSAAWQARQHMTPHGRDSVRVVRRHDGAILWRAIPRKGA
jgi:hypothetical protein